MLNYINNLKKFNLKDFSKVFLKLNLKVNIMITSINYVIKKLYNF